MHVVLGCARAPTTPTHTHPAILALQRRQLRRLLLHFLLFCLENVVEFHDFLQMRALGGSLLAVPVFVKLLRKVQIGTIGIFAVGLKGVPIWRKRRGR